MRDEKWKLDTFVIPRKPPAGHRPHRMRPGVKVASTWLGILLLPSLLGWLLLVPASAAAAKQPHSWCLPGKVLNNPPDPVADDATTQAVVKYVCSTSPFKYCCDKVSKGAAWTLACTRKGADYAAKSTSDGGLGAGDVCGRYAWTQGPIVGTQQYYPRDFNLVALNGPAIAFHDIQGPLATYGDVAATGFAINSQSKGQGVGLVTAGNASFRSGNIFGNADYVGGKKFDAASDVTFPIDGTKATSYQTSQIPFSTAAEKLVDMSSKLKGFGGIKPTKPNANTLKFTGTDLELNVFAVNSATDFKNITSYEFAIPNNSAVIVNVAGKNPQLSNCGFSIPTQRSEILWNFYEAETLTLQNLGFPGSILAPKASAQLQFGNIDGTVVVGSAVVLSELHWYPYRVPGHSCTLFDTTWNCSAETVVDDTGQAVASWPEAGFFEVWGGKYTSQSDPNRVSPTHRVWYSFQPATFKPETKPVAVLFNGGPGSSTSCMLLGSNTGSYTIDPNTVAQRGGSKIVSNPYRWNDYFNLLYIDAPATGFSYPNDDNLGYPNLGIDLDREAGTVLDVVIRFLDHHPLVQKNPVIIVGESYGGTRATLMLQHLFDYPSLQDTSTAAYKDQRLYEHLTKHFAAVFGQQNPTPDTIAHQFSHQILIQPAVAGRYQLDAGWSSKYPVPTACKNRYPNCQPGQSSTACDQLNCVMAKDAYLTYIRSGGVNLTNLSVLSQILGVDPTRIMWLRPESRNQLTVYGRGANDGTGMPNDVIPGGQLDSVLGALNSGDNYLLISTGLVKDGGVLNGTGYNGSSRWWTDNTIGTAFLNNLRYVKTFITDAEYDLTIRSRGIVDALNQSLYSCLVTSSEYQTTGGIRVTYKDGQANPLVRDIRMPFYAGAGHSVPIHSPAQILKDVTDWYASTLTSYPDQPASACVQSQKTALDVMTFESTYFDLKE